MPGKNISLFALLAFLLFAAGAHGQYDVPYEPSSPEIVAKMLSMAAVTKNDTVYDLGCGDGRIVIAAVKDFGATGVGIDIDPVRIKESTANAAEAHVTERIRFIEKNLFEADIRDATVMTLFLWPEVNLRLRPKLFRELRPGTRIVSHEHDMGEWAPDRSTRMDSDGMNHHIYLWVLPANVSGTWSWSMTDGGKERRCILTLAQKFQKVEGVLAVDSAAVPLRDVSIEGKRLRFTFRDRGRTFAFDGAAGGNAVAGTVTVNPGSKSPARPWKAERDPSTVRPIDE